MNLIFYLMIFALGTIFGSFLTLATHRIPLNQDITHERSYCPKCNHKLSFFDLIPILSYTFLHGRCRYCKAKIGIRYFLIEILTGISFITLAFALKMNIHEITSMQIIEFILGVLYIVFLFLIGGIDLEHNKIDKRVLIYGTTIALINIIYQYILCTTTNLNYNLNRVIIYLIVIVILNLINITRTRKNKNEYILDLLIFSIIISLFTYEIIAILTITCTLLIVGIKQLISRAINKKKEKNTKEKAPLAFYMAVSNAIIIMISCIYLIV